MLVANKMDLAERVQVLRQDGMQMAQELQHSQSALLGSARGRLLRLLRARLAALTGSAPPGERLAHWAASHCLGCSSKPPPKPPISPPLTIQELGLQYAETSAKDAQDVEEPFKLIAAAVKRAFDQSGEGLPGEDY